jgi:hypothetical protein
MSKNTSLNFTTPMTEAPKESRKQMVARLKRAAVPVLFKEQGLYCWQIAEVVDLTIEQTESALRDGIR